MDRFVGREEDIHNIITGYLDTNVKKKKTFLTDELRSAVTIENTVHRPKRGKP